MQGSLPPGLRLTSECHLTLAFLGEGSQQKTLAALEGLAFEPLPLALDGKVGWFPAAGAPRVCWLGLKPAPGLHGLRAEVLRRLDLPAEEAYAPHITLGRVPERMPTQGLREAVAGLAVAEEAWVADALCLYRSELRPQGAVHTEVARYSSRPSPGPRG